MEGNEVPASINHVLSDVLFSESGESDYKRLKKERDDWGGDEVPYVGKGIHKYSHKSERVSILSRVYPP